MFKLFLTIALITSFTVQANCIGEAQLNGKINKIVKSFSSCRAFLSVDSNIQQSAVCPLDEGKLNSEGIEIGLMNGHDCKMEVGDMISGILVDNGFTIYLE